MIANALRKSVGVADGEQLPAYAWPGGYPIYYLCADGGTLCPKCANGNDVATLDAPDWNVTGYGIHWEGEPITCDGCNAQIASAYGIPGE